jgi:hypothetical protein
MKLLNVFALATLFTLGSGASVLAQQPKFHRHLSHSLLPRSQKVTPQQEFVDATIRDINYVEGLLTLNTDIGVMQIWLTPEETLDLRVGDKLQVRVLSADRMVA